MVGIVSDIGKGLKKIFKSNQKADTTTTDSTHGLFSFGTVYANDKASAEIEKPNPQFSEGAIIVREKNSSATSAKPEMLIAMVKRDKGFSKETGDWEFFTFQGQDLKLQKRETKSDCSRCHVQAEKTDWVFKTYLK